MRALIAVLALVACVGPAPAMAASVQTVAATPRPADWPTRVKHAEALAKATQPEELVVGAAMREMDRNMVSAMRSNEQIHEIEAALPGFSERYYAAARTKLEEIFHARLPKMWGAVAEAFAAQMTVAEIDSATRFFSSPLGAKIVRLQTN